MKFKGSKFEERYNSFWNNEVVSSYKLLISHPEFKVRRFFSENYPSIDSLLKKYCNSVLNIVNNMQRQMNKFDDNIYIAKYFVDVKLQAIDDLNKFKTKIESRFKESPHLLLISKIISKLEEGDSDLSLAKIINETDLKAMDDSEMESSNSASDVYTYVEPISHGFNELKPSDFMFPELPVTTNDMDMDMDIDMNNLDKHLNLEDPAWRFN